MQDFLLEFSPFVHRHLALFAALAAIVVCLIILEFIKQKTHAKQLSTTQAIQYMNHQNALVVDLRNAETFANGHIIDAVSIPLAELTTKQQKLGSDKNRAIIMVCGSGIESAKAAEQLRALGYDSCYVLAGGIQAWRADGLPIVKE